VTISILQYVRERRYSQASIPDGQLALWDIVIELARRVDALEAARNGSDEKHEAAPIAEGHAVLAVGEPILELEGELKDDMWTYLLAAGLNELAVRVVIYAEEGEGQS